MVGVKISQINPFLTCVAVSPSSFKLCALRDLDNDGTPNLVALRSNSSTAARFLNSTVRGHGKFCTFNDLLYENENRSK